MLCGKKYFKPAFINLRRYKLHSFINILGLSIGILCFIAIFLWVGHETKFDKFHENYKHIYRLNNKWPDGDADLSCPGPLALVLKTDYPEIVNATRYELDRYKLRFNNQQQNLRGSFIDLDFFEIFSFSFFFMGIRKIALMTPNSVVLTERISLILFGSKNPIGEIVYIDDEVELKVSGVLKDVSIYSHLNFDFLASAQIAGDYMDVWYNNSPHIYITITPQTDYKSLENKITKAIQKYSAEATNIISLEPLNRIHLYNRNGGGLIVYIYAFSIIAVVILLMACANYIILSISFSIKRSKEIAIRKALGASRKELIFQLLGETLILTIISSIIAMMSLESIRPLLSNIIGHDLIIKYGSFSNLTIILIILIINLIAGLYPAISAASFNSTKIFSHTFSLTIAGERSFSFTRKSLSLKNILILSQFIASSILITSGIIINKQLNYIQNKDLGYSKENIITIPLDISSQEKATLLKDELLQINNVVDLCYSSPHPIVQDGNTATVNWIDKSSDKNVYTKFKFVDHNFIHLYNIELVSGRNFNKDLQSDYFSKYIINEKLAKDIGFDDLVGKEIALNLSGKDYYGEVIGIMSNFHDESLHNEIRPITLLMYGYYEFISVKLKSDHTKKDIAQIESIINKHFPTYMSEYGYIEDQLNSLYGNEKKVILLIQIALIIAIIIAGLGLLGLTSFSIETKQKEIAIRKVNGANFGHIFTLLIKNYIYIIIAALIISIPVTSHYTNKWLSSFAFHINIHEWVYLFTFLIDNLIVIFTVGFLIYKKANKNPVNNLRYE